MRKLGKYEFLDKDEALEKIALLGTTTDELGVTHPNHKHTIIHLGNVEITPAEYDEEGIETTPAVLSDKYSVDTAWFMPKVYDEDGNEIYATHPDGWEEHSVEVAGQGSHAFLGLDYQCCKIGSELEMQMETEM